MPADNTSGRASPEQENPESPEAIEAAYRLLDDTIEATEKRRRKRGTDSAPPQVSKGALSTLRSFAKSQGLIVLSPACLAGFDYTGTGNSDELVQSRATYSLVDKATLFPDLHISKAWRVKLEDVASDLLDGADLNIRNLFAAESAKLPQQEGEAARWTLLDSRKRRIAIVVRLDDPKRYLVFLWWNGWYQHSGPLPYDLPLVGLPEMLALPSLPVMVHEGPKAAKGAAANAASKLRTPLRRFLAKFAHVGWQGAKFGIDSTDWSPLAGRDVVVAPDMDGPGHECADLVAKRLALYGVPVRVIRWPDDLQRTHTGWDFADVPFAGFPTESEIRESMRVVESPLDARGIVLPAFVGRTAYCAEQQLLYTLGSDYRPMPRNAFNLDHGQHAKHDVVRAVVQSAGLRRVRGAIYLPGERFGDVVQGRINMAQPPFRSHLRPRALTRDEARPLLHWLRAMVPDREQRRLLIDRAAWAISHPGDVPRYMVVIQGVSSIGKSLFFDMLCAVVGKRDAVAVYPSDVFGGFNSTIADKRVVCLHEIHSNDITLKQNGERLKDLIANSTLRINEKFVKEESRPNITHWFAGTNEGKPFELAHDNDRFYFCIGGKALPGVFFREQVVPLLQSQPFLDRLYAAALAWRPKFDMRGRAPRQAEIWETLTRRSRAAWKQYVVLLLDGLSPPASGHPICFMDIHILNLVAKRHPNIGAEDVRAFLRELGFDAIKRHQRKGEGRGWVYAKVAHIAELRAVKSALELSMFGGGTSDSE